MKSYPRTHGSFLFLLFVLMIGVEQRGIQARELNGGNLKLEITNEPKFLEFLKHPDLMMFKGLGLRFNPDAKIVKPSAFQQVQPSFRHLTEVDLKLSRLGDERAAFVVEGIAWDSLESLDCWACEISDQTLDLILRKFSQNRGLVKLNLSFNNFSAARLSTAFHVLLKHAPGLKELRMFWIRNMGDGANSLESALPGSSLEVLNLGITDIGDSQLSAIARALPRTKLRELYLHGNEIRDQGVVDLAKSLSTSHLEVLDLSGNQVGDEGVKALARSLSGLRVLKLNETSVGYDGVEALLKAMENNLLLELDVSNCNQLPETVFPLLHNFEKEHPFARISYGNGGA